MLLTKLQEELVRSGWLDVDQVLLFFCVFMEQDRVEVDNLAKKVNKANISPVPELSFLPAPYSG